MKAPTTPPILRVLREGRGLGELPRLAWNARALLRRARGNGEPVLVFPGFGAGDASTLPLRSYLRLLGYDARGWGLGLNRGNVGRLVPKAAALTLALAREAGRKVRLVGWSLGGYLAREAAREHPDAVERVVTLGTPVVGGPKYTAAAGFYTRRGYDLDQIEAAVEARGRVPLRVPVTAVYSRADGVVAWEACIDRTSPDVEHVEVESTHLGLGLSPDVYRIVADRLSASPSAAGRRRSAPAGSR